MATGNSTAELERLRDEFRDVGYVVVSDLLDARLIQGMHDTVRCAAAKFVPASFSGTNWDDEALDRGLMGLRGTDPRAFSAFFDTLQISLSLQRLVCADRIIDTAAALVDEDSAGLGATGHMLRVDVPNDTRNRLDWHQEISYYDQNSDPNNGVVVWIPMRTIRPDDGSMIVCPSSHRLGQLGSAVAEKPDYRTSEQLRTPTEAVSRFEQKQILGNQGDVVFFHMSLIHCSGRNVSERVRFSAGVRFHRLLTNDFLPGRFVYQPNEYVKALRGRS